MLKASISCSRPLAARPQRLAAAPRAPVGKVRDVTCAFFNFGKKNDAKDRKDVDWALPEQRAHYQFDDVEEYFNYMGFLATEGSYDRMEALKNTGLDPCDIILLLACEEGDTPKIVELLACGAHVDCKNNEGKTPMELAKKPEVISVLKEYIAKKEKTAV